MLRRRLISSWRKGTLTSADPPPPLTPAKPSLCLTGVDKGVEARYRLYVSQSTTQPALAWSLINSFSLVVLAARTLLGQDLQLSALRRLPLFYSGTYVMVAAILLFNRQLFVDHRQHIWVVCGVCRLISHILVVFGDPYSDTTIKAFSSVFVWPVTKFTQGAIEQVPFPVALAFALAHFLLNLPFYVSIGVEPDLQAGALRSGFMVCLYLGGMLLKNWHSRTWWLCKHAGDTTPPNIPVSSQLGAAQLDLVTSASLVVSSDAPAEVVSTLLPAAMTSAAAAADTALVETGASAGPASFPGTAPTAASHSNSTPLMDPHTADTASTAVAAPHSITAVPAAGADRILPAAVAAAAVMPATPAAGQADPHVRRGRRAIRYRPAHAMHRTSVSFKLHGFEPADLQPDAAALIAEEMLREGQLVLGMSIREGCIEVVIDLLDLRARADGLPANHHNLQQQSIKSNSEEDVFKLLACLDLPFDANKLRLQIGRKAAAAGFAYDRLQQRWVAAAAAGWTAGAALPSQPLWVVTPIAATAQAVAATRSLKLQTHMSAGSARPSLSVLAARMGSEFCAVADHDCGDCHAPCEDGSLIVQVPAAGISHCLLQLDIRPGGMSGPLCTESCGVLLLDDPAVAAELVQKLQPMMLDCVTEGDAESLEELQYFIHDLGTWLKFVSSQSTPNQLVGYSRSIGQWRLQHQELMIATANAMLAFARLQQWSATVVAIERGLEAVAAAASAAGAGMVIDVNSCNSTTTSYSAISNTSSSSSTGISQPGGSAPPATARCSADGWSAVAAPTLPWSYLLHGFPDPALEARFDRCLHRARGQHHMMLAVLGLVTVFVEARRCLRGAPFSLLTLVPATPFVVWASAHVGLALLRARSPRVHDAFAPAWPLLLWLTQSSVPVWLICRLPTHGSFRALSMSKWAFSHEIVHLGLPALFMRASLPVATILYTLTCVLMIWMRITLGSPLGITGQVLQELPAYLLAVGFTAMADFTVRHHLLAQEPRGQSAISVQQVQVQRRQKKAM